MSYFQIHSLSIFKIHSYTDKIQDASSDDFSSLWDTIMSHVMTTLQSTIDCIYRGCQKCTRFKKGKRCIKIVIQTVFPASNDGYDEITLL